MDKSILKDNLIIIGPYYIKKKILEINNMEFNIKFFTIQEFNDKYLFKYRDDTLVYLNKKYGYIPEIGEIILNNLYEIDEHLDRDKLNKLYQIKQDLENNGYIIYDNLFKTYLNNKDILVFNYGLNSYSLKLIDKLKEDNQVTIINDSNKEKKQIDIYEFDTLENEVIFLCNSIKNLIEKGIDINKIKINKLSNEYTPVLNRIFNFYNIPIDIKNENKLYYLSEVKDFLNNIDDNMDILDLNTIIDNLNINVKIKDVLIKIINKYTTYEKISDIKNILIYDLKNTNIVFDKYTNIVEVIDYKNYFPEFDEYVFMLGFNQGVLPLIHTDNKFLSDKELKLINSDTSVKRNEKEEETLLNFINNTKNLTISYKLSSNFNEYTASSFIKKLETIMNVNIKKEEYNYKNKYVNKLLLGKHLDEFVTYNIIDNSLESLYSTYPDIEYNKYDNTYKRIKYNTIKKRLNNKLNLSFSNINTFYKCGFRFLLNDIFKLGNYKETNSIIIGKIFHEILCYIYKNNLKEYDEIIDSILNKYYINPSKKDMFYMKKYKEFILKLIYILNDELNKTSYENTYFEEFFSIDKSNDLEIKIVGIIDKVMTLKDEENTYVIVIDYKTGVLHGDFNKVIYGLDMQLLMYLYLIKNSNKINNPKFTGMYLQSILCETLNNEENKTYEELINDNMRLTGYTIKDVKLLKEIDNNYDEKSYIKSIRVKKDGEFYSYSKVLTEENISSLLDIVKNNIDNIIESVKKCKFDINPKKIDKTNVGCEYCEFKDICYMNNNNIVELKKHENLDFLDGDSNDTN